MDNIEKWIVNWFVTNGGQDEKEVYAHFEDNYFAVGFIDSFQFINLIADAEEKFDIEFNNEQFADRSFSTIYGFASIIRGMILCE